ncbi:MAG: MmgE/PrpD family protein [Protaetiibacter sp.]
MQELARWATTSAEEGLPSALREDVAARVLDLLGNALAASGMPPGRIVRAVVQEWGGSPAASVIGGAERYPRGSAALVNGTLAHSLDFDDTHLPSVLHPSASVVPAALAAAEATGASGARTLDAIGIGIEICVRLGMAGYDRELGNSIFFERGFHATAICGAIGAAAAAAIISNFDAERTADAIGIAASMGSGLLEANRTGGTVKRMHCGWAAHGGLAATDLARHGMTAPPSVIEGRFGFLSAFCGDGADVEAVTRDLGTHWELPTIFFKPYPCNHFTHAGIDAALTLRAEGVDPEAIEELVLGAPTAVLRTIAHPEAEKARPRSGYHAAFSGPYTVAAALLGGGGLGLGHEDFTDAAAADPARLELAARVRCVPDARCDEIFPYQFPAVLTARLHDGTEREVRIDANRGGTMRPLTREELEVKFRMNAEPVLGRERATEVIAEVTRLAGAADVRRLMALAQTPQGLPVPAPR